MQVLTLVRPRAIEVHRKPPDDFDEEHIVFLRHKQYDRVSVLSLVTPTQNCFMGVLMMGVLVVQGTRF